MKKIIYFTILLFLLLIKHTFSQDIHSSQSFYNFHYYFPSIFPIYGDNIWGNINYRQQWNSFTKAYNTYSVNISYMVPGQKNGNLYVQAGYINDNSYNGIYSRNYLPITVGYNLKIGVNMFISFCTGTTIRKNYINYSRLNFPDEWNNTSSNFNNGSAEVFQNESKYIFDVPISISYYKKNFLMCFNSNYYSNDRFYLSNSYNNQWNSVNNWKLSTLIIWNIKSIEGPSPHPIFIHRLKFFYTFHNNTSLNFTNSNDGLLIYSIGYNNVSCGLGIRNTIRDILINVGFRTQRQFRFEMTYDMNTSRLVPSTNLNGAFEISIIYESKIAKNKKYQFKNNVCYLDTNGMGE